MHGIRKCSSEKYRDAGIPQYVVTSSIVDNRWKNVLPLESGRGCHVAGVYVGVLMYANDLLLISSTCSDLRRLLRTVFSKPTVYNTVTFNTAAFF